MPKFRKKPVEIEAWLCEAPSKLPQWLFEAMQRGDVRFIDGNANSVEIKTLEGTMRGDPGDWIIKGVKGEIYPCKPDIFAATYDEVIEQRGVTVAELEKILQEPDDRKVHINPDGSVTAEVAA